LALRLTARAVVNLWTSFAVMPAEIVSDTIEAELERRGVAEAPVRSYYYARRLKRQRHPNETTAAAVWSERTTRWST
jgi:hypothetical protein